MRTMTCGLMACAMLMGCAAVEGNSPEAVTIPRADNTSSSSPNPSSTDDGAPSATPDPSSTDDSTPPANRDPARPGASPSPDAPCFQQSWYKNGQLRLEGACVCVFHNDECTSGVPDGLRTHWFKSGTVQYEYNYDDGVAHGTHTSWYESGQKQQELSYDNGILDGFIRQWDQDSTLTNCSCYVDGAYSWSDLAQCDTRPCPDPTLDD